MKHRDIMILKKIQKYCAQCEEAIILFGDSLDVFKTNSVYQNACCMCILQIGELCKLVSEDVRDATPEIPWKQWTGNRDIFAHQYSNLDCEIAWETIHKDVPQIKARTKELLK